MWPTQERTTDRIQSSHSAEYSVLGWQKAEIFKIKSWLVRAMGHLVLLKSPLQGKTGGSSTRHAHSSKYPASLGAKRLYSFGRLTKSLFISLLRINDATATIFSAYKDCFTLKL